MKQTIKTSKEIPVGKKDHVHTVKTKALAKRCK